MCPERDILSAYVDGEIPVPWEHAITEHLAGCPSCRAVAERLEYTRRALRADDPFDWQGARERVRLRLGARMAAPLVARLPFWRRQVSVPLPLALLAAGLVIALGVSLSVSLSRASFGLVRITKAPTGTEIQIAAPISDLESLLAKMGGADSSQESVLTLPKNVRLVPVGEPRMGLEAEFAGVAGKKP